MNARSPKMAENAPTNEEVGLARISHQVSTAAADPGMSTALRSVGLLDVLSSTPAGSSRRAPCIHARLRRLATEPGEKCGLMVLFLPSTLRSVLGVTLPLASEAGVSVKQLSDLFCFCRETCGFVETEALKPQASDCRVK